MSKESLTWLNTNTLIGCTSKRGHAWHWRAQEQGAASNHYPGPIPMIDVQDRLFHWTAESRRLAVEVPADRQSMTHQGEDGTPVRWAPVTDRQAICRSDDSTGSVLGIFGPSYTRHQYREWLLTTVADLLDDDLVISSAGLLRGCRGSRLRDGFADASADCAGAPANLDATQDALSAREVR